MNPTITYPTTYDAPATGEYLASADLSAEDRLMVQAVQFTEGWRQAERIASGESDQPVYDHEPAARRQGWRAFWAAEAEARLLGDLAEARDYADMTSDALAGW